MRSDTENNCSAAVTVTVGAPDLVVDAPTVSNSSPTAGASFTLNATVRNQGTGQAAATTLRYYRSTDATVSTSDTEVGTDPCERPIRLSHQCRIDQPDEPRRVPAPTTTGPASGASAMRADTGNNCSSAVTVTVGAAPATDLVVDAPTVSTSTPTAGASFALRATVRNQGNRQSAAATTLRYYRSTDATITTQDTEVGTDAVGVLAPSRYQFRVDHPYRPFGAPAPFYYGACVDAVSGESDTENNCSAGRDRNRGPPGSRRRCPYGQHQHPDRRGFLRPEGHGTQPGQRSVGLDHPALLPFHRRDDLCQRHRGGGPTPCLSLG